MIPSEPGNWPHGESGEQFSDPDIIWDYCTALQFATFTCKPLILNS